MDTDNYRLMTNLRRFPIASDIEDNKTHVSGRTTPTGFRTMAGKKSIAEELIEAINMPKMRPIPAYISESDATSVQDFLQCNLAREYMLDTSKITWGR